MNLADIAKSAISEILRTGESEGCIHLMTPCLYPSNAFVVVYVYGGENEFTVSDRGGAIREVERAGVEITRSDSALSAFAKRHDLIFRHGAISTPLCSRAELSAAIAVVANASKELADHLFEKTRARKARDIKTILKSLLVVTFPKATITEDLAITGASNKAFKFGNVVTLDANRRLIVDPVIRDPNSINARFVANMDVKRAEIPGLEQRIIYDDEDNWSPAELSLLSSSGAPLVALSKSAEVLRRFASA